MIPSIGILVHTPLGKLRLETLPPSGAARNSIIRAYSACPRAEEPSGPSIDAWTCVNAKSSSEKGSCAGQVKFVGLWLPHLCTSRAVRPADICASVAQGPWPLRDRISREEVGETEDS